MTEYALLFTDVVDSTRQVERLGDARAAEVWAAHDFRARNLLALHHGREIGRGDGLFLLFATAVDATSFAVAYHEGIADLGFRARIGIHFGLVILRENSPEHIALGAGSTDMAGLATSLTARLMVLAQGGQTLVSAATRSALADPLPEGIEVETHGYYRLKGIDEPIEVFEVGMRGVSTFFPPSDTEKAYRVIRAGDLWRPVREVRHNLPAERDVFVGRTAELRALAARLDAGCRLLTILGPGGAGKTRCVRRYGWTWLGDWPGGVYFCDLSEATSLDGIFFAVASALEVPLGKDDPATQLGHAIAGRGRCLVVFDNFEQVVKHAPATVGRWLDRAGEAAFVVTSRERLQLAGEESFPMEPLPLEMDAIDLFAARARAQKPDFVLGDNNLVAVAEAVRLLDGLPLAIELAAARVRLLSPAQIVERMRDRFALLASDRGAAARQATLRAAIDWSWDLLSAWEQDALSQCSIFEGSFTLDAAEAVLDLSAWPQAPAVMDAVQALLDKSLLRTWIPGERSRHGFEQPRFGMYLSIHEYAAEKLVARGPEPGLKAEIRHGGYFAGFGTDVAIEALSRQGGVQSRSALARELDNLVAACRRAIDRGDGETAVAAYRATWEVLELRGPFAVGAALGVQALALPRIDASLRATACLTLARTLRRAGRIEEAQTWLTEALTLARDIGDRRREGSALLLQGNLDREQGRTSEARDIFDATLVIAREVRDRCFEGRVLYSLGLLHSDQGRAEEARGHYDAALAIAREVGNHREEGTAMGSLGLLLSEQGLVEDSRGHLEAAIAIAREMGDRVLESVVLANLGKLYSEQGRVDEARQQLEAALAIHREVGNRRLEGIALGNLGVIHLQQSRWEVAQEHCALALAIAREVGNRRHEGFLLFSFGLIRDDQGRIDEAWAEYEAALAVAREVGDRRTEGIVLGKMGLLRVRQCRFPEARSLYDQALVLAREVGSRPLEGVVLGGLGDLQARLGQFGDGLAALRAGETLLREACDREELAKLLCMRGRVEVKTGERERASAALAEAESHAAAMCSMPDSELGREIAALRKALG